MSLAWAHGLRMDSQDSSQLQGVPCCNVQAPQNTPNSVWRSVQSLQCIVHHCVGDCEMFGATEGSIPGLCLVFGLRDGGYEGRRNFVHRKYGPLPGTANAHVHLPEGQSSKDPFLGHQNTPQARQDPPQSTPVSSAFWMPSVQLGAVQKGWGQRSDG